MLVLVDVKFRITYLELVNYLSVLASKRKIIIKSLLQQIVNLATPLTSDTS
ncbi:MAG: hypothetical protein FD167_2598 [bacterium]|nr:MAG: hypothetical protein FD167_2598 [bacterium]